MMEEQPLLVVKMIASELGYTVRLVCIPDEQEMEVLVFERECESFHSFLGNDKVELALRCCVRKPSLLYRLCRSS